MPVGVGIAILGCLLLALGLLPGWFDPDISRQTRALGELNRPVTVGAWVLIAGAVLLLVFELFKAHGRVAMLYAVEQGDRVWVGTWLGSWGVSRRRIACQGRVLITLREEPSVNPNGLRHYAVQASSGGRSLRARAFAAPTPESIEQARRWMTEHGRTLTTQKSAHSPVP